MFRWSKLIPTHPLPREEEEEEMVEKDGGEDGGKTGSGDEA